MASVYTPVDERPINRRFDSLPVVQMSEIDSSGTTPTASDGWEDNSWLDQLDYEQQTTVVDDGAETVVDDGAETVVDDGAETVVDCGGVVHAMASCPQTPREDTPEKALYYRVHFPAILDSRNVPLWQQLGKRKLGWDEYECETPCGEDCHWCKVETCE
jgi:hypothetical protein